MITSPGAVEVSVAGGRALRPATESDEMREELRYL